MTKSARTWVRAPKGPIPKAVRDALRVRLEKHVRAKWNERCHAVSIRFRGAFAYIDAFPLERVVGWGDGRVENRHVTDPPANGITWTTKKSASSDAR